MKFDAIIDILGAFGPYQKRLYVIVCIPAIFAAFQVLIAVFSLAIPNYRCSVPELGNDTYKIRDTWHEEQVNFSIPWTKNKQKWERSSCKVYNNTGLDTSMTRDVNRSQLTCEQFVYDLSTFQSTVISEWNLVCGGEHMRSLANMLLMGGVLIGAVMFGLLSDLFGRKFALMVGIILNLGSGIGSALAPNFASFVFFRMLAGCSTAGTFMCPFVLGVELVGPSKRTLAGIGIELFWCLGLFILAGMAYGIRNWRYLQLAVTVPSVLLLVIYWLVPESPRWLLSKGKEKKAEGILRKAAEYNKVELPDKIFDKSTLEEGPQAKVWEMFTNPTLCIRMLIIFFNWCVVSMVYYGLGLNVGNLGGNVYVNFTISSAVEGAAYVLCIFLLDRLGRKALHCGSMLLGGIACIATIFPVLFGDDSLQWVVITLSMVGKLGASGAFAVIFVFTAELLPTVVRNSGVGVSSFFARVGSMASPYVADLGKLVKSDFGVALPLLVFGGLSVAAGLLSLLLPETLGKTMPETIEDAKNLGRKQKSNQYRLNTISEKEHEQENGGKYNRAYVHTDGEKIDQ